MLHHHHPYMAAYTKVGVKEMVHQSKGLNTALLCVLFEHGLTICHSWVSEIKLPLSVSDNNVANV